MAVLFFCCLTLAALMAGSRLLARVEPVESSHRQRLPELDGLRGLLALAVVFHHSLMYPDWLRRGVWENPASISTVLGQGAVAMFFMITGSLFWPRLLARRGRVDWQRLYVGRVFRIVPVYLLASGLAVAATFGLTRQLNVPWSRLAGEVAHDLAGGATVMEWVNNYNTPHLLVGVTWTLRWEWGFYLALLPLSLVARSRAPMAGLVLTLALVMGAMLSGWVPGYEAPKYTCYVLEFGVGMLTGSLVMRGMRRFGAGPLGSAVALLALVLAVSGFSTAETLPCVLCLAVAFVLIANGADLFGVLTSRAFRRLGAISYGIYLLHGLSLAVVFRPGPLASLALSGPVGLAIITMAGTGLSVLFATVAHLTVERPGQALGVQVDRWLRGRRGVVRSEAAASET